MNWYRVIVSFEVEGESEEDATREANQIVTDGIVESVTFVEEIKPLAEQPMPWCDHCQCWHHETARCINRSPE